MDFSARIKELRENRGLSQQKLAELLNIPRSSITNYETGGMKVPRQKRLNEIADFFGVTVDYLIGRTSTNELNPFEKNFVSDMDELTLEEIIKKYAPNVNGKPATKEEIEFAIKSIRLLRESKE